MLGEQYHQPSGKDYLKSQKMTTFSQQGRKERTIDYLQNHDRKVIGSEAFNLNYDAKPTQAELRRDIVSYLGEYRLQVQKYDYELVYGRDKDHRGEVTLRDQDRGESLQTKAKRTLQSRKLEKKPTHREEAEDKGLKALNDQLRFSQNGDTVIWASPPGPKDQGYGEYGFIYAGKVIVLGQGEKRVAMTAIRVEKPKKTDEKIPWIQQFANVVNTLTSEKSHYQQPEDFLASPKIIQRDIPHQAIDKIIQQSFTFTQDEEEREKMANIIKQMHPLIEEFISRMDSGTEEERLKAFYVLENYALELKNKKESEKKENIVYEHISPQTPKLNDLMPTHSFVPPPIAGSCGRTGGSVQSTGLSFMSSRVAIGSVMTGGSSREPFNCPDCHYSTTQSIGNTCPGCGLTKEAFAERSGVKCD